MILHFPQERKKATMILKNLLRKIEKDEINLIRPKPLLVQYKDLEIENTEIRVLTKTIVVADIMKHGMTIKNSRHIVKFLMDVT